MMRFKVGKALLLMVLSFVISVGISFAKTGESDSLFKKRVLLEKKNLEEMARENLRRADDIILDRLKLTGDREWLMLKIMRIKSQKRHVPEALTGAKSRIELKLKALAEEEKHLTGNLENSYKKLGGLDSQVRRRYGKSSPEWWRMDPLVAPKVRAVMTAASPKKGVKKKKSPPKSHKKAAIQRKIKSIGLGDWVELVDTRSGPRLENRLPILFASGKTSVSKEYGSFFKKLAKLIKSYPSRVVVEGFTDRNRITSKKYDSNFELGARRAANVVNELIKYGVSPSLFSVESRGEYGQSVPGSSKRSRALSRRAEITVFFKP